MKILAAILASLVICGCSSKEQSENRHQMSDELQDIQKAKKAATLVDSINALKNSDVAKIIEQEASSEE